MNFIKQLAQVFRHEKPQPAALIPNQIQISCNTAFYGTKDYGGWRICTDNISSKSIVYSFGVGEDATWDVELIAHHDVKVFAFDPTPKSIEWVSKQALPDKFVFTPIGIANFDGTITFFPPENEEWVSFTVVERGQDTTSAVKAPVKRLETLAVENGHTVIDILKIDIEGAEYDVLEDLMSSNQITIHQILVEFHHHFPEIDTSKTITAIKLLNNHGYKIFDIGSGGYDFCFIKK